MKIARSTKTLPITGAWGWGQEPHPTHPSDLNPGVLDAFLIEIPWKSSSQHVPYQINVSENRLKINDLFRTTTTCILCFGGIEHSTWKAWFYMVTCTCICIAKGFPCFMWLSHKLPFALCELCSLEHTGGISISRSLLQRTDSSNWIVHL